MNTNVTFEEYRTWLLDPNLSARENPLGGAGYKYREYPTSDSILAQMDDHSWEQETAVTDVSEFSSYRTRRILNHRWSAPPMLHRLNLTQLFAANDHGLSLSDSLGPTIEGVLRDDEQLIDVYGEYLARNPQQIENIERNRAYLREANRKRNAWTDGDDMEKIGRVLDNSYTARNRLFHRHLRAILGEPEYTDVQEFDERILKELYPVIWIYGLDLYQQLLRKTRPVNFRHYTWDHVVGRWKTDL